MLLVNMCEILAVALQTRTKSIEMSINMRLAKVTTVPRSAVLRYDK